MTNFRKKIEARIKKAEKHFFNTNGNEEDEYEIAPFPLTVEWHWEIHGDARPDARDRKTVAIDKLTNSNTGEIIWDRANFTSQGDYLRRTENIDVNQLADWIADEYNMGESLQKEHEEAFGPPDTFDEPERFIPREYKRIDFRKNIQARIKKADEQSITKPENIISVPVPPRQKIPYAVWVKSKKSDGTTYEQWERRLDKLISSKYGLGMMDFPDWNSMDAYESNKTVEQGFRSFKRAQGNELFE